MKQYQLNNISNALGSYLSARRNKQEADTFMQGVDDDPNMDAYEKASLRLAFKRDYSNTPDVAKEYLGYRQKKQQQQQMQEYRDAMLAAQSARSAQTAAAQSARNKQAAMKQWITGISKEDSPYRFDPKKPESREAAQEYGYLLGLQDEDMYLPGQAASASPQMTSPGHTGEPEESTYDPYDLGFDPFEDQEEDEYEDNPLEGYQPYTGDGNIY